MRELTDDQLLRELRAALGAEASSIRVTDGAARVARIRARSSRRPVSRWALTGIAAAIVIGIVAGAAFVAWHWATERGPMTGSTPSVPSASPTTALPPTQKIGKFVALKSAALSSTFLGPMATALADGRVLIIGNDFSDAASPRLAAMIYDPATGSITPTGPMTAQMAAARNGVSATRLRDGRVLLAGGTLSYTVSEGGLPTPSASAELFDPATGKFSSTGSLTQGRGGQMAFLLPDGRVLIAYGLASSGFVTPAEIYDPNKGSFSRVGSPSVGRQWGEDATLLADGRILITGGMGTEMSGAGVIGATDKAEIFDPATGTFSLTGSMAWALSGHTATLLDDGRVLIAGGPNPAELYDPGKGAFSPTGPMITARTDHAASRLADGRVLIVGGLEYTTRQSALASAEFYDPTTSTFGEGGSMSTSGSCQAASLSDGRLLIYGFELLSVSPSGSRVAAEVYEP